MLELAASFERMRDAMLQTGENGWIAPGTEIALTNVGAYIEAANGWACGQNVAKGWVPTDVYWIVEIGEVVGELAVRHRLTPHLREIGGHIGYMTHPNHRGKGVATYALGQGLKVLAAMDVAEAIVTCRDDNSGSIRVIEKCGGIRARDSIDPTTQRRRYVFPLYKICPRRI